MRVLRELDYYSRSKGEALEYSRSLGALTGLWGRQAELWVIVALLVWANKPPAVANMAIGRTSP